MTMALEQFSEEQFNLIVSVEPFIYYIYLDLSVDREDSLTS